jgi:peptidoglycan-associated lipoprotein
MALIGNFARTGRLLVIVGGLGMALAACSSIDKLTSSPDKTDAPAAGFEKHVAGSEEDFMLNVGRRTYFTKGSHSLDDTAKVTLEKQAQWLAKYGSWKIKVQGFSDDPGSADQNKALSKKRAQAVYDYLTSKGVASNRMWLKGYGRERLVRDCADISCKSQNRRVISNLRDEFET